MGLAEVGGSHFWAGLDLRRYAFEDVFAEVKNVDVVTDRHDKTHVVLHNEYPDAVPGYDIIEYVAEPVRLVVVQARRGLVQEK
jgi:hypothetical protein